MTFKPWGACATFAVVALAAGAVQAANDHAPALQMIGMSASLNEMAISCGHQSASDVRALHHKQRQSFLDQGISAAEYEKEYAKAKAGFHKQWGSVSKQQQQGACDQAKALSEQAAAQLKNMPK